MAVVLRDVPPGLDWGFYSNEEPRMHIQTINPDRAADYKVWLEHDGRRPFDPLGQMPGKVRRALEPTVVF